MTQRITDSTRLESELSELQAEIQASLKTIGKLREIQQRFEGLLTTYNEIQAFQKRARSELDNLRSETQRLLNELAERDETYSARFASQMNANDELWKVYRQKFLELHNQLSAAQKNFRLDMATQQREFEGGIEERLAAYTKKLEGGLTDSGAKIDAVFHAIGGELQPLKEQLRTQGNYAEQLGREQKGQASAAADVHRRLSRTAKSALGFGITSFLLLLLLAGGTFYVLFLGGEMHVRQALGL